MIQAKVDKLYFKSMLKYKYMQEIESEIELIRDDLIRASEHNNNDEYYLNYLKQKVYAYNDFMHYLAKFGFDEK